MRVLHLISSVYFFGAERVVAELSASLLEFGVTIHIGVICSDAQLVNVFKKEIDDRNITITGFVGTTGSSGIPGFAGKAVVSYKMIKELGQYLTEKKIDIIHCHGYKSNCFALVAKFLSRKKPYLVSTNHNWMGTTAREYVYQKIDALVLRFFDTIIAVSPDVKLQMVNAGINVEKITIIDNGINTKDTDFSTSVTDARALLGLNPEDRVIGNIARLTPEKAHIDLLNAFAELNDCPTLKLVLVGDGSEYNRLQNKIEKLGLQGKVIMAGNRDDARKLYVAFDVFALVSTNEGLPMVLLEAMAANVPVIATRVGAIPDVIDNGKNGLLVNPSNKHELVKAIRLLLHDCVMRKQFANAGRQIVEQSYSSQYMAGKYYMQYEFAKVED